MVNILFTVLVDIFFIIIVIVISTNISNIIASFCAKWINIQWIVLAIHLYIICVLYRFFRLITTNYIKDTGTVALLAGPMVGYLSNYFIPYMKYYKIQ